MTNVLSKVQKQQPYVSRREREIRKRLDDRVKSVQERIFPNFPQEQVYDVILLDPPWKYDKNTQLSNVPKYNQLSFNDLSYLPIRRVAKQDSIMLMWTTAPMMDKAISLLRIFGYKYVTVFQNWIKLQNGQPAKNKSGYSDASSEFLLWAEKGRTTFLKTPDQVPQVVQSEITRHSEKPNAIIFQRLMQKLHLNKLKCLEIFARSNSMKYFDVYGEDLNPQFQTYPPSDEKLESNNVQASKNFSLGERVEAIMSKIKYDYNDDRMTEIINQYQDVFALESTDLGKTPIAKHNIRMQPDAVPKRHNAYRLSPKEKEFLEGEIELLLKYGRIERCEATWVLPVIMVRKKDTPELRMCIDFRPLNELMIIENYPIPRIDEILSLLAKFRIFTKLDIKSGFWQVELEQESMQYTGFITPIGTFRWKVMPFGLKNAPATFQRVMEEALRPLLGKICTVYIDDIIIFSNNEKEHRQHVQKVFDLLRKANLKVGVSKCEFFQKHIDILGHHISNGKITPQSQKLEAIRNIPQPENRSQIRSFVGMCSYYRSFIKHFSQKCEPLMKLTRQNSNFEWTDAVEKSFQQMKYELSTAPILDTPTQEGQYILHTDFSEKGLGAVLSQQQPNESVPRVIEYASRSLRGAEINYPAYEGEVLAVHWALEKFRHYLHGVPFKLYTDNKALSQVLTSSTKSKKIIRWLMEMQEYNFIAEHRPGQDNANADALSRLIKVPEDINVKLNNQVSFMSYQAYSTMYQGSRFDEFPQCNTQYISEGVGDLHCKKCNSTHTKVPMLICECCGEGHHTKCIGWTKPIPKEAWYCQECLQRNSQNKIQDVTMDFQLIEFLKGSLNVGPLTEEQLTSLKIRASSYKYVHNRIYYVKHGNMLLIPTIAERKLLVQEQHRMLLHPSIDKLRSILRQNFYWTNMEQLIQEVTYNCQVCQARKNLNLPSTTYQPTNKGHEPWHTVSMDLAPELTITNKGNRHLLVIVDNFSKYTLLLPIKDKSSQTIADALYNHLICMFGTPKVIRVDQGTEFKGDVEYLAERWGIEIARATTYHPQANGIAEKMIDVVKRAITAAINDPDQPLSWDDACYPIQMSINAAVSRATGISPYMVLFGRVMPVPQSIIYGLPLEQFQEPNKFELQNYHKKLNNYLKQFYKLSQIKRKKVDSYNKQQYEKLNLKKQTDFQKNQLVFIKRSTASRWSLPNIGPFIFLKYSSASKKVSIVKNPATGIISKQSTSNLSPWKEVEMREETQGRQVQAGDIEGQASASSLDRLVKNVTDVHMSDITNQNVSEYLDLVREALTDLPRTSLQGMPAQKELLKTLVDSSKTLSAINNSRLQSLIVKLSIAIDERETALSSPQQETHPSEQTEVPEVFMTETQDTSMMSLISYQNLFQYTRELETRTLQLQTNQLTGQAKRQAIAFNQTKLISRVDRQKDENLPLHKTLVGYNRTKSTLTKDQCNYLLRKISINEEQFDQGSAFPAFNPDFHFSWSIFALNTQFPPWDGWNSTHRPSQLALEENKGLHEIKIAAKFAFTQGCRWIRITFDSRMNMEFNERIGFIFANDRVLKKHDTRPCARVFLQRDVTTGAWDSSHVFIYADNQESFFMAYYRYKNLSPILTIGVYEVDIISPKVTPGQPNLPSTLVDLPEPYYYERMLPTSNTWVTLNVHELRESLAKRCSYMIGFGSVYIKDFANSHYAVHGQYIQSQPVFQQISSTIDRNAYYNWDIQSGSWKLRTSFEEHVPRKYLEYISQNIPSEPEQLSLHDEQKLFKAQNVDVVTEFVYGSNHFWTIYDRTHPYDQVIISPDHIHSNFFLGVNPYKPDHKIDFRFEHVLLAHSKGNDLEKATQLLSYVDMESQTCLELAIRFRRVQCIQGYKQPYLTFVKPTGTSLQYRIPTVLEFLNIPVHQQHIDALRKTRAVDFYWVPRPIAEHINFDTNAYYSSKKELRQSYQILPQIRRVEQPLVWQRHGHRSEDEHLLDPPAQTENVLESCAHMFPDFTQIRPPTTTTLMHLSESQRDASKQLSIWLKNFSNQPFQIFLKQEPHGVILEWNLLQLLELNCSTNPSNFSIVGLRHLPSTAFAHWLAIEAKSRDVFLTLIRYIISSHLFEVYIPTSDFLRFPAGYSILPLQFALGLTRVNITNINTTNDLRWFTYPLNHHEEYLYHPVPGCVLSPWCQNIFYTYDPLISQFIPLHGLSIFSTSSQKAKQYRLLQTKKTTIYANKFEALSLYSSDPIALKSAAQIRCPQEERAWLTCRQLRSRWFHHDLRQPTPAHTTTLQLDT